LETSTTSSTTSVYGSIRTSTRSGSSATPAKATKSETSSWRYVVFRRTTTTTTKEFCGASYRNFNSISTITRLVSCRTA
jgi:hypothetical protein